MADMFNRVAGFFTHVKHTMVVTYLWVIAIHLPLVFKYISSILPETSLYHFHRSLVCNVGVTSK